MSTKRKRSYCLLQAVFGLESHKSVAFPRAIAAHMTDFCWFNASQTSQSGNRNQGIICRDKKGGTTNSLSITRNVQINNRSKLGEILMEMRFEKTGAMHPQSPFPRELGRLGSTHAA